MSTTFDRRRFLQGAALAGAGTLLPVREAGAVQASDVARMFPGAARRPVCIASFNGLGATARAMELLAQGTDTLDAVIAGVNLVEDDPQDMTVGYGGLPNEDGDVELDASVMHGPTGRGAGVAALKGIRNPSKVAKVVMERSDHVLLVGEGALRFAKAHGFHEENLLTEQAREEWLRWKESLSREDDWLPPHGIDTRDIGAVPRRFPERPTGTINCLAVNAAGDLSGVTTTSGLAFKIPGRVGDSPILGAGLYVDNEVGAAGSTGRGEANLLACSSTFIVDCMRRGVGPEEACLQACERIVRQTRMKRLLDAQGRPAFNVNFYALHKSGTFGGASLWSGMRFAVNDGSGPGVLHDGAYLYKRESAAR
jgi:N4-(beta-N-acetylglucosaminyl)-L-asparaginase